MKEVYNMKIWKNILNIILALAVPIGLLFISMMIGEGVLDLFLDILNINYDDLSYLEEKAFAMFIPLLIIALTLLVTFYIIEASDLFVFQQDSYQKKHIKIMELVLGLSLFLSLIQS